MLMKKNEKFDGHTIKDAEFPYLGINQEYLLNEWKGRFTPYTGHDIIAKVLTLAGYSEFNKKEFEIIDEETFNIFTKDGRTIKVRITYGNDYAPGSVIITDNNIEDYYDVIAEFHTNNIIVEPEKTVNLSNNFIQYYKYNYDSFGKEENGIKLFVSVGRTDKSRKEEFFFIDEDIKKEFINTKFNNLLEVYYFLTKKFNKSTTYMKMSTYNDYFYLLDNITISNGIVNDLELSTLMTSNKIRLTGDDSNTMVLNDLIENAEKSGKTFRLELR